MNTLTYFYNELPLMKCSGYVLQLIENRTLSKIYHSHDFMEIILILRGSAVHFVNDQLLTMNTGDCIILLPHDRHCFQDQSEDLSLLGLSIQLREFQRLADCYEITTFKKESESSVTPTLFSCASDLEFIQNLVRRCCLHTDNVADRRLLLSMLLHCYCCGENTDEDQCTSPIPPALQTAVNHMHEPENIKEGLTALIRLTSYSRPHLYRLMNQYYHQTPHEFILKLRMQAAYSMLSLSDTPVEIIAEKVGYNSISHFNTIFKQCYGISPAKLRKRHQKMPTV